MSETATNGDSKHWKPARKKPVKIQYRGPYTDPTVIETLEGDFEVDDEYIEEHGGFVVIKGVQNEVYPCGLDVFQETYDLLGGETFEYEKIGVEDNGIRVHCPRCGNPVVAEYQLASGDSVPCPWEDCDAVLEYDVSVRVSTAENGTGGTRTDPPQGYEMKDEFLETLVESVDSVEFKQDRGETGQEDFYEVTVGGTTFAFDSSSVPASSILEEAGASTDHHYLVHIPTERTWRSEDAVDLADVDELWVHRRGAA